jgi:hypothetical protein
MSLATTGDWCRENPDLAAMADIAHHPENTGLWFHDVLMADGRPYHEEEMALVQTLSKGKPFTPGKRSVYPDIP